MLGLTGVEATHLKVAPFLCGLGLCLSLGFTCLALGQSDDGGSFMNRMESAMALMDKKMNGAPMDGNVDHDFAAMMVPHHEGAIEMAKAELLYGKDPQMRRIAQEILVDQQSEIDLMQLWLKRKGGKK